MRRLAVIGLCLGLVAVLIATCSGDGGGGQTATPAPDLSVRRVIPPPAATEAEARTRIQAAINSFDLSDSSTLNRVVDLVDAGRRGVPTLLQELRSDQVVRRWAAAYALSNIAEPQDTAALRPGLTDSNLTVRAIVAGTLLRLGNEEGLAVLRQAAASEEVQAFSEPPQLLRDYAQSALKAFGKTALLPPDDTPLPRFGLMQPPPRPQEKTEIRAAEGKVEITVNIEVSGPGVDSNDAATLLESDKLIESWKKGIEDMWSGKLEAKPGVPITVTAKIQRLATGSKPTPGFHSITVKKLAAGAVSTSFVSGLPKPGKSVSGEFDNLDSPTVVAHEAGHLLGIDDEYEYAPDGKSVPKKEVAEANKKSPRIMVQTWPTNGVQPSAAPDYAKTILDAQGFDPSTVTPVITPTPPTPTTVIQRAPTITPTPTPTATPSPTPTPTPTPTPRLPTLMPTPTPTITPTPTPTPTITPTPTAMPTLSPTPTRTPTPVPLSYALSFVHTAPGAYSEVFLDIVQGPPNTEVTAILSGPAVGSPARMVGTTGADGKLRLAWRIFQFGTYGVIGIRGDTNATFSGSITVQ